MAHGGARARVEIVAQPEKVFCNAEGPRATYVLVVAYVLRCKDEAALADLGAVDLNFGLRVEGDRAAYDKHLDLRAAASTMRLSGDQLTGQAYFRVDNICSKHVRQRLFKFVIQTSRPDVAGTTSAPFLVLTKRRLLRKAHRDVERARRREVHRVVGGFLQVFAPRLRTAACLDAYMTPFVKICGVKEDEYPDNGYPTLDQNPQELEPLQDPSWLKGRSIKAAVKLEKSVSSRSDVSKAGREPACPVTPTATARAKRRLAKTRTRATPKQRAKKARIADQVKQEQVKQEPATDQEQVCHSRPSPRSRFIIRNSRVHVGNDAASCLTAAKPRSPAEIPLAGLFSEDGVDFEAFETEDHEPLARANTLEAAEETTKDAYETDSQMSCGAEDETDDLFAQTIAQVSKDFSNPTSDASGNGTPPRPRVDSHLKRLNSLASQGCFPSSESTLGLARSESIKRRQDPALLRLNSLSSQGSLPSFQEPPSALEPLALESSIGEGEHYPAGAIDDLEIMTQLANVSSQPS